MVGTTSSLDIREILPVSSELIFLTWNCVEACDDQNILETLRNGSLALTVMSSEGSKNLKGVHIPENN